MLLDDLHTGGMDQILSAIDSHPNIEVRLFNPFANRSVRWLEMLAGFKRLDRRMHNKSMTVDNQMSLVGGRNVGDAYFSARTDMDFSDLDVLIAGPAVPQVSAVFDEYWNDQSSYPVVALIPAGKDAPVEMRSLRKGLEARGDQAVASPYVKELLESGLAKGIESGHMPAYSGKAVVVSDKAAKITHQTDDDPGYATVRLEKMIDGAQKEVLLISPYFVPDNDGEAWLIALARRGIRVRILTNSFAATDVSPVHAGYAPHRLALVARASSCMSSSPAPTPNWQAAARPRAVRARAHGYRPAAPACMPRTTSSTGAWYSSARSTWTRARPGSIPRWASCWTARRWPSA